MASSLAVPSPDVVRRATDKWLLAELSAGAGLQSPPTTVVERAEIAARASDLPTPAVIKPLRSKVAAAGGSPRGDGRRVESPSELRAAAMPGERLLVQPHLPVRSYRSPAWHGRGNWFARATVRAHPSTGVRRERVRRDNPSGHRAAGGANREIAAVYRLERDLPGAVHSLRRQALPHRLEPRIVGSLALPVATGLNLRAIWVDLLLGRRPGRQRRSRRDRFRSEEKDAVALLGAFARRQFREGSAGSFHGGEPCTPLSLGGCRSLGASPRSVVCNRLPVQGAGSYLVEPPTHVVNA